MPQYFPTAPPPWHFHLDTQELSIHIQNQSQDLTLKASHIVFHKANQPEI